MRIDNEPDKQRDRPFHPAGSASAGNVAGRMRRKRRCSAAAATGCATTAEKQDARAADKRPGMGYAAAGGTGA
ncbi:hypothetical protein JCM14124_26190 [Humidesulfovibrio idahonensis]